ncbi:MAG: PorT family protein [Saprospiraceae bacterium]|nr:PorT family protein [Saprospiraceae bacterium]
MLKFFISAILLLSLFVANIQAQSLSIGPVVGANFSTVSNVPENKTITGLAIGGFLNYSVNEHVGINAKVLFSQLGTALENSEFTNRLNYIQIPLTGVYFFGSAGDRFRPKVFAGPYLGFLMSAKDNNGNELLNTDGSDFFKKIDFGGIIGVGFNYLLKSRTWLNVDAGYSGSFASISEFGTADYKNTNIGISVGVSFPIGTE